MMNLQYKREIINQLEKLSPEQRKEVLNFVQFIGSKRLIGAPGSKLLDASDAIGQDDLRIMSEAIENECERVNLNEW